MNEADERAIRFTMGSVETNIQPKRGQKESSTLRGRYDALKEIITAMTEQLECQQKVQMGQRRAKLPNPGARRKWWQQWDPTLGPVWWLRGSSIPCSQTPSTECSPRGLKRSASFP